MLWVCGFFALWIAIELWPDLPLRDRTGDDAEICRELLIW